MISDYVMLQQNCQGTRVATDSIGLGSYTMDSHNCQRIVQGGVTKNEGDVQSSTPAPYGISYRSIVPRAGECENLFVPFALSASHIAFGSIRMEPVFMILGQSAATAAAFAIDDNVTVQQLDYTKLKAQLIADKQLLTWGSTDSTGVVDNADASGVTVTGAWTTSTATAGFWGANYIHDQNAGKGIKSVRFTPNLPVAGDYEVYLPLDRRPEPRNECASGCESRRRHHDVHRESANQRRNVD
jgi:FAD dependent oxidoreductase